MISLYFRKRNEGLCVCVDHAVIHDLHVVFRKDRLKLLVILHQRILMAGEVVPLYMMGDAENTDAADPLVLSFNHTVRTPVVMIMLLFYRDRRFAARE